MLQAELQQLRSQQEAVWVEREAERAKWEAERQRIQALEAQREHDQRQVAYLVKFNAHVYSLLYYCHYF
jgi:hypothetical protein